MNYLFDCPTGLQGNHPYSHPNHQASAMDVDSIEYQVPCELNLSGPNSIENFTTPTQQHIPNQCDNGLAMNDPNLYLFGDGLELSQQHLLEHQQAQRQQQQLQFQQGLGTTTNYDVFGNRQTNSASEDSTNVSSHTSPSVLSQGTASTSLQNHESPEIILKVEGSNNLYDMSSNKKGNSNGSNERRGSNEDSSADPYSRRKAQNRAAQRAFRERKEMKLKELRVKLMQSEEEKQKLSKEVELLKQRNTIMTSENKVLLETRNSDDILNPNHNENLSSGHFTFPEKKFYDEVLKTGFHKDKPYKPLHVSYVNPAGDKVVSLGTVWDMINSDPDNELIDIDEVMEELMGNEKCDGMGPAYSLRLVQSTLKRAKGEMDEDN